MSKPIDLTDVLVLRQEYQKAWEEIERLKWQVDHMRIAVHNANARVAHYEAVVRVARDVTAENVDERIGTSRAVSQLETALAALDDNR